MSSSAVLFGVIALYLRVGTTSASAIPIEDGERLSKYEEDVDIVKVHDGNAKFYGPDSMDEMMHAVSYDGDGDDGVHHGVCYSVDSDNPVSSRIFCRCTS